MSGLLWVALGGGLGSAARYIFSALLTRWLGDAFPWGIFLANVLGCLVMGLVAASLLRLPTPEAARLFVATGFLGGFTTFSAFAYDTLKMLQGGQAVDAIVYVFASVLLSLVAVLIGFALGRLVLA